MTAVLKVENIRKSYPSEGEVLRGISLNLNKGETKVIVGPSGTGKSTLLRCINRLTEPDSGKVWLSGEEVTRAGNPDRFRPKIGFVFQHFNLFHHLSALKNVTVGLTSVQGLKKDKAERKGRESLEVVRLS